MQLKSPLKTYTIWFCDSDPKIQETGFEVCLALITLDFPVKIVLAVHDENLNLKLDSLKNEEMVSIYDKKSISFTVYENLLENFIN